LIQWDFKNREASCGALRIAWKLLARMGAKTLFCNVWTINVKVMKFQSFLWIKNWLNYLLFWKNHKFHIACPNTTKQSFCTPMCKNFPFVPVLWHLEKLLLCESHGFFKLKNEINYILFWKIHNFPIACPKAMKQNNWPSLYIDLFIHATFVPLGPT